MASESKYKELLSKVHQGVPLEKSAEKTPQKETEKKPADIVSDAPSAEKVKPEMKRETEVEKQAVELVEEPVEPISKTAESPAKRKRKPQADYQSLFFNRIDLSHRKPLYITANTHRRLMRIVHLMDESKATISSYVENIILHHLETFKEEIDNIYQTNNINPTE